MNMVWLDKILGPDDTFSLEDRTLNAILFSSTVFGSLAFISDLIIQPGIAFNLFSFLVLISFGFLFYKGRSKPNSKKLVIPYLIIYIIFITFIWQLTGGINGPSLIYLVTLVFITPIFVKGTNRVFILVSIGIYAVALLLLQLNFPELVQDYYADPTIGLIDTFITVCFLSIVVVIVMMLILYSYEKQKQKAEALGKTKDKFFSIISHDLRNPLASMTHLSQMLMDQHRDLEPDYRQEFIRHIYNSSNETYYLLENLLQWAKSESKEFSINPENINLLEYIELSSKSLLESIRQKEIKLTISIPGNHLVYCDKNMLMTVLRNLLSNAIKFTEKGGLISISACNEGQDKLQLMISDTGIGIEKNRLDNLLNDKLLDSTKGTNNEQGSGLGLNLCQEFITKNNGDFRFESELNLGSTFYVTLPIGVAEETVQISEAI